MGHPMAKRVMVALTALYLAAASFLVPACAYNHTVGGTAGWFFDDNTNTCATDYTKWAAGQTFKLGDFLIFNTDTTMILIQTYNSTTYDLCGADVDNSKNLHIYFDDSNSNIVSPMVAEVPLTVDGPSYYLSAANGRTAQCLNGMRFKVTFGTSAAPYSGGAHIFLPVFAAALVAVLVGVLV